MSAIDHELASQWLWRTSLDSSRRRETVSTISVTRAIAVIATSGTSWKEVLENFPSLLSIRVALLKSAAQQLTPEDIAEVFVATREDRESRPHLTDES